jgi:uncharacterized protein
MAESARALSIEVVYALREDQALFALKTEPGTTVGQAIERSGILRRFPEIDLTRARVGIFGKSARLDTRLRDGDRVEIYRPLIADPKDSRRERAKRPRSAKRHI